MSGPVTPCGATSIEGVLCKIFCRTKAEGAAFKADPANAGRRFNYSQRAKELAQTTYRSSLQALGNFMPENAVRLCSDVCLYLDGPPDRYREGLLDFYRIALDEIGPSIRQVRVGQDGRWKPRPKDLSPLLAHWFDRGGPSKGSFSLRLEAGEQPEEASDQAFEFCWILGQGHVRLVLPVERALVDGDRFKDLVVRLASRVRFKSGTAGISANIVRDYPAHRENGAISAISQRYLGIDLGRPQYWNDFMSHGLKTVNWITLLGPDMLERAMAGRTQVRPARPPRRAGRLPSPGARLARSADPVGRAAQLQ